jgi:hypothetical protein
MKQATVLIIITCKALPQDHPQEKTIVSIVKSTSNQLNCNISTDPRRLPGIFEIKLDRSPMCRKSSYSSRLLATSNRRCLILYYFPFKENELRKPLLRYTSTQFSVIHLPVVSPRHLHRNRIGLLEADHTRRRRPLR